MQINHSTYLHAITRQYITLGLLVGSLTVVPSLVAAQSSSSSSPPPPGGGGSSVLALEEITVTARKRDESLQDIPLSITTFNAEDIENAGFQGLQDLSLQASGLQFHNQGGQQPGRYNTQLRFRGMNTAQFSPSFATGALFIDGVYVLNGGTSLALDDVERVEVIKGPQAAQFGRNTFGGAVNLITKTPSLEEVEGKASGRVDHRGGYELSGNVSVPVVPDQAALFLSARLYDKRGHYQATDGGRLGNEETWSVTGKLYVAPTDNLTITVRGHYAEDNDGPAAGGFIAGEANDTCTGLTYTTDSGETAMPRNYVCGTVPDVDSAVPVAGQRLISSNTGVLLPAQTVRPTASTFFLDRIATARLPTGVPEIDKNGLKRETRRFSARVDYEHDNDWGGAVLTGYNRQGANWIRDFDLTDRFGWLSRDPQYAEDWSVEARIYTPEDNRWRASAGINYYEQEFTSSGSGGDSATGCFAIVDNGPCFSALFFPNGYANNDQSEVLGVFGSLEYDLTMQITLSFEGRWQQDDLIKGGRVGADGLGAGASTISTKKFLPRAIIRYQPVADTTLYFSYARGVLNGDINTDLQRADARERAQYAAQLPSAGVITKPELLDAFELGLKQVFWDGRARFSLAGYYNQWRNQKGRTTALINETCDAMKFGDGMQSGCMVSDGIRLGDPAMISDGMGGLTPLFNSRNALVTGDARLYGIELESVVAIRQNLTAALNLTWARNEFKDYLFNFTQPIAGFTNMKGNTQPRFPEWSGNLSTTYSDQVSWFGHEMQAFVRLDTIYFGKAFVDEANLAETDDYFLMHLRAGVDNGRVRTEVFINNLLDEDAWSAGSRWSDFSVPTFFQTLTARQGIAVSPQEKRTIGLRVSYSY